jgi:pectate lyase
MSKKTRNVIITLGLLLILGGCAAMYVWHIAMKSPETGKEYSGAVLVVKPSDLAKEYTTDEKAADAKYLQKVLKITGTVTETEKSQDGLLTVIVETGDPSLPIQCAMEDKNVNVTKGQNVTIQGTCTGSTITGVSLTKAFIIK